MISWFLNPWMLLGGLAIASPILIHLLNKRRFKIVEWAAMDFLFQADKKNRRRVELENLILLCLRCLAMILLALMLARPFLPSSLTAFTRQSEKIERIILIDDSLSQRVLNQNQPAMETIKESVLALIGKLAASDKSENWLTVVLTSRPDQPLLANEPLTMNTLATLTQSIESIEVSDLVADYSAALTELNRYMQGQREAIGKVIYFYSDMRERDWLANLSGDADSAPHSLINDLSKSALGCFVIDVGHSQDQNLAIIDVRAENLLSMDTVIRFNVTVANYGSQTDKDVRVIFQVDEGQARFATLPPIAAGQTQSVSFLHSFPSAQSTTTLASGDFGSERESSFRFHRVIAEIDRQSLGETGLGHDQLLEDSSAIFAAKVRRGSSVLLIDGDPSASSERSETHYLKSLQVPGTGLDIQAITVSEFETIPLSPFQVIFLCNVDEFSKDRIDALRQWVENGGGLVLMPGNRVRASSFNAAFYEDGRAEGRSISPVFLTQIAGSPSMSQWVNFDVAPQLHPALRTVVNSDAASLSHVDIFSWWQLGLPEEPSGNTISVPLRMTDEHNSLAMVEQTLGSGKVVVFSVPADGDWTMWPSSPTYAPVMIDLISHLIGDDSSSSTIQIGNSILIPVDLAIYEQRVGLRNPKDEKIETIARPLGSLSIKKNMDLADSDDSTRERNEMQMDGTDNESAHGVLFDNLQHRGFYQVELKRHDGQLDRELFAANHDPRESNLKRLSESTLETNFFSDKVLRVSPDQLADQTVSGGNSEIWPTVLLTLFGVLVAEQVLAWWWGRKR